MLEKAYTWRGFTAQKKGCTYMEEGLYTKNALHVGEEGYTFKLQPWIKPACLSDNNIHIIHSKKKQIS